MTTIKTDVIIVGAGPTGLSLACQLARYGIDFVIVEKNPTVTAFSKALGVHARTLEIYEQLDIARQALKCGTVAGKVRMLEGGEIVGEVDLSRIGEGLSPYPYMLVLEQSRNEELLYEYVQSHGRDVRWQTVLESFSHDDAGVTAHVKDSSGATHVIEGKYLVGCDGASSPIRIGLGLSFEGSTFPRMFYVADVEIDWKFAHDALHGCLTRHSVLAFFPMPGERRWRIVGVFPDGHEKGEILYEEMEAQIKKEAQIDLDITRCDWFSTYKVHTRHVEKFSEGRCFLAGDSAHIHTPAGGQGMNTGIQDAYNLAWKLALVLKRSAPEKLLNTYNEERLPNAKRLVETTDRMFNFAAGTDWFVNLIRTTVFPPMAKYILSIESVRKRFFVMISQIGIAYRDSSLSMHEPARSRGDHEFEIKAGERMPYFLVDGKSIYDRLREPCFHLLTFSDGDLDYQNERRELENKYGDLIDHHVIPLYPHVVELFDRDEPFSVLLRPDNYIGFIAAETSLSGVTEYLNEIMNVPAS